MTINLLVVQKISFDDSVETSNTTTSTLPKIFMTEDPSSSQTQPEAVHPDDEEFSSSPNPQTQAPFYRSTNPGQLHIFTVDVLPVSKW